MATSSSVLLCVLSICFCFIITDSTVEYQMVEQKRPCPLYELESNRFASSNHGLVNCSWYAQKACCKRTEVTSVFSNMFSLYGATLNCKNHMNYLMCYFCDPDQYRWYKSKAHVCADFCRAVYTHCKDAKYDGKAIGTYYRNGSAFCEAQNFRVVEGDNCFDYDPTVFGRAAEITQSIVGLLLTAAVLNNIVM